jgi:hypothetical protein
MRRVGAAAGGTRRGTDTTLVAIRGVLPDRPVVNRRGNVVEVFANEAVIVDNQHTEERHSCLVRDANEGPVPFEQSFRRVRGKVCYSK